MAIGRVGIVGGGQLGRMLALAAAPLGIGCTFLDPSPDAGAAVAANQIVATYDDAAALARLAAESDVVTFEFENVPAQALAALTTSTDIAPSIDALETSQDRLAEKQLFEELGIAIASHRAVGSLPELKDAFEAVGAPAVLKTRRLGYDGKGQVAIDSADDLDAAWEAIDKVPAVLERRVPFDRELSIIAVRGRDGETAIYPLTENRHRDGILRESMVPAISSMDRADKHLRETAESYVTALLDRLGYVGVLALELFQQGDQLLANEIAPRVHNSGHWTLDGAVTSQFENHIRAVAGLPLGSTEAVGASVMLNLIGGTPNTSDLLNVPGAHLHLYAKAARPGRKVGHVTLTDTAEQSAADAAAQLLPIVEAAADG